jgi:opacity protein-like surface antigen
MRAFVAGGIGLAVFGVWSATALAADLDYPPPPSFGAPAPQYEFGTGWYLRGDVSAGEGTQPAEEFGALNANHSDWGYGIGGGVGYKWNSWFRTDVTGDYFQEFSYTAQALDGAVGRASIDRYAVLANGYLDLGTWYGFTPYVGGGVGAGIFDPSVSITGAAPSASRSVATQTQFAWAVMAGLSYTVDSNVVVDLGYRHLDLGRYGLDLASYEPNFVQAGFHKEFTRDEVRLGIRYMID